MLHNFVLLLEFISGHWFLHRITWIITRQEKNWFHWFLILVLRELS